MTKKKKLLSLLLLLILFHQSHGDVLMPNDLLIYLFIYLFIWTLFYIDKYTKYTYLNIVAMQQIVHAN